jgi:2-aminoadipate transaminase
MEKLLIAKQASDLHTARLSQRIIADFMADGHLTGHIDTLCEAYHRRSRNMGAILDDLFGNKIERSNPQGGMFMWVKFHQSKKYQKIDTMALFNQCYDNGVAFVPGQPFYIESENHPSMNNCLRLNYSNASLEQLQTGLERLYDTFRQFTK